jgi:serine phosphatase RsbU (regulator of sigma subunit)
MQAQRPLVVLPPSTSPRPAVASDALHVLLVEDDAGDAYLVRELLETGRLAVTLIHVQTVRDAVAVLPGRIDCVLLDLGLPDAMDLDGLHRLRAASPRTAIVVLTGLADQERGLAALAAGAHDFLVKGQVDEELLGRSVRYAVERRRSELSQQELQVAELHAAESARLERGLMPAPLVAEPRLTVATLSRPGRERTLLGGDFFDAVELPDGTVRAVIGDVAGHGPDEAAVGVFLRIAWRTLTLAGTSTPDLLRTLEEVLVVERHEDVFTTLCTVELSPDRRRLRAWPAGHPAPVLVVPDGAAPLDLTGATRLPLGVDPGRPWPCVEVALPEAWALVLHTDGLVEGRLHGGAERIGEERLVARIADRRATWLTEPAAAAAALVADAEAGAGGALSDDVAVLALACGAPGR